MAPAAGHADGIDARDAFERFSPVGSAWSESFMSAFPRQVAATLLADARETVVKAGELLHSGAEHADINFLALIADGLVCTYIRSDSGRQVTIRYAWPGDVVGAPAVVLSSLGDQRAHDLWRVYGGHVCMRKPCGTRAC